MFGAFPLLVALIAVASCIAILLLALSRRRSDLNGVMRRRLAAPSRWWPLAVAVVLLGGLLLIAGLIPIPQSLLVSLNPATCSADGAQSPALPPKQLQTADDYLAQGAYDFDRGSCDAAIADFSHALQLNPNFAEAYNSRAYTYMIRQQYELALPDLDRALAIRPDYVNALMNRGDIHNYYYAIDYNLAIADYDRVLRLNGEQGTSVCGHRMLAVNHGWNPGIYVDVLTGFAINSSSQPGCSAASPGY